MKRIIFTFAAALLLLFLAGRTFAQYERASMWAEDMHKFAAEDELYGAPQDVVLFAGSSTFRMWPSLEADFPDSKALNRAFGGSYMTDLIYFFHQVVKPYSPRQVVLYEGDNDLMQPDKSAESFLEDVITMTRMIHIHYPRIPILLVSIKPSPSRSANFAKFQAANTLMKAYADKHEHITFVSIWEAMLDEDGAPDESLYLSDRLHMNRAGYDRWKKILEPHLAPLAASVDATDK